MSPAPTGSRGLNSGPAIDRHVLPAHDKIRTSPGRCARRQLWRPKPDVAGGHQLDPLRGGSREVVAEHERVGDPQLAAADHDPAGRRDLAGRVRRCRRQRSCSRSSPAPAASTGPEPRRARLRPRRRRRRVGCRPRRCLALHRQARWGADETDRLSVGSLDWVPCTVIEPLGPRNPNAAGGAIESTAGVVAVASNRVPSASRRRSRSRRRTTRSGRGSRSDRTGSRAG